MVVHNMDRPEIYENPLIGHMLATVHSLPFHYHFHVHYCNMCMYTTYNNSCIV